jgi:hypothetical protein
VIFVFYVYDLLVDILVVAVLSHLFAGILLAKKRHLCCVLERCVEIDKSDVERGLCRLTTDTEGLLIAIYPFSLVLRGGFFPSPLAYGESSG